MFNSKNNKYQFADNSRKYSQRYENQKLTPKNGNNFENVLLTHSRFYNCTIENVSFKRAAVTGSVFERCEFLNCELDDADFEFCEFRNCKIKIEKINGCSFNNSNFIVSNFLEIKFIGCTFTGAYFEQSEIINVKIEYSTLEGACFSKCSFKDLDWRELNLEYVEFIEPIMCNVVLPFFQVPYMFGTLKYLANTADFVRISNDISEICLDEYFKHGIPFLLEKYEEEKLNFPMSNIYLFGRNTDYNKAFDYLAREVSALSMVRDFRGIKFCCKLISMSKMFERKHLNRIYKNITDIDISIDSNSAEMRSFARNIGEIRSILFNRKKEPSLTIQIKTNIGIEHSMRFSNLMHQFQKIAKPNHTDGIYTTFKLAHNSPLIIDVIITGSFELFLPILHSFLILTGVPLPNIPTYPLVKSLLLNYRDNGISTLNTIKSIKKCQEKFEQDGIELTLMEYYVRDCDEFLDPREKSYYVDKSLLAITTGGVQDVISGI